MTSLATYLRRATRERWAVPHFNISDLDQLKGIAEAAAALRAPVMIGTSEGERDFIGLRQAVALIAAYRAELGAALYLNADHTKSVAAAKKAIDAGYPSVHLDLSRLPFHENLTSTREIVRYARRKRKQVNIEGELGYLATESSKVYAGKVTVDPETFTKPTEAVRYVRATGAHRLAPAVGNFHGIAKNRKKLDFALIRKLRATLPGSVALVLHGGSGSGDAAFRKAIRAGIANVHISTELRIADTTALKKTLREHPDEMTPYKLAVPSYESVKKLATKFIILFGARNKA